jgi:hypothetical protein
MNKLGFVFSQLGYSQQAWLYCDALNKYDNKRVYISTFIGKHAYMPVKPAFPYFGMDYLMGYDGDLITTSIITLPLLKSVGKGRVFYYMYDPEWMQPELRLTQDQVKGLLKDVYTIPRTNDFAPLLIDIPNITNPVDDFHLKQIESIIYGSEKENGKNVQRRKVKTRRSR